MDNNRIEELKRIFDNLGRGTSGRLIIESSEEIRIREIIEEMFANKLALDN